MEEDHNDKSQYIYSAIKLKNGRHGNVDFTGYYRKGGSGEDGRTTLDQIKNLSKLNIFVGENDSGKSRLMRMIAKQKDPRFHVKLGDGYKFDTYEVAKDLYEPRGASSTDKKFGENLSKIRRNLSSGELSREYPDLDSIFGENSYSDFEDRRVYIPVLRSLANFNLSNHVFSTSPLYRNMDSIPNPVNLVDPKNLFSELVKDRHFPKSPAEGRVNVFSGYELYDDLKGKLLGSDEDRKQIKEYQAFLSDVFFDGKRIELTPKEDDEVVSIKIGEQESINIYDLGDGLQNIIIISFLIFTEERKLFFIEEPEKNTHPGLQRKLVEIFLGKDIDALKDKGHQFFITTHSNHLLDTTIDYDNVSVYRFSQLDEIEKSQGDENSPRIRQKLVENVEAGDRSILRELGVLNSSVFLANKVIFVEGITDRMYVRKWLQLYMKNEDVEFLREGIDYTIAEYAGSNIAHWLKATESEKDDELESINLEKISPSHLFIADKDEDKGGIHELREDHLGGSYLTTEPALEIENLLSIESIEDSLNNFSEEIDLEDKYQEYKNEDTNKYSIDKYKGESLGGFIDENIETDYEYSTDNGKIKSGKKTKFARGAIKKMSYEKIPIETREFVSDIYDNISEGPE